MHDATAQCRHCQLALASCTHGTLFAHRGVATQRNLLNVMHFSNHSTVTLCVAPQLQAAATHNALALPPWPRFTLMHG
jgi:hypothetical protein